FKFVTRGLPFVALKTAMTLDGKIATHTGDSRWITNEKSREYVHRLRNTYDAVLVGIGTVLKDDPRLNTRLPQEDTRDPVRLIIDARLETPTDSRILQTAGQQETIIYCLSGVDSLKVKQFTDLGAEVVAIRGSSGRVPLEEVFRDVAQRGLMSVLMEAGSQINAYALEKRLVDKVYWFIAPRICGGDQAVSPVGGRGIELMSQTINLKNVIVRSFEGDLLVEGYVENEQAWPY
ncbi:MAG: RibD family protein, partial [Bacillota bacterium]